MSCSSCDLLFDMVDGKDPIAHDNPSVSWLPRNARSTDIHKYPIAHGYSLAK